MDIRIYYISTPPIITSISPIQKFKRKKKERKKSHCNFLHFILQRFFQKWKRRQRQIKRDKKKKGEESFSRLDSNFVFSFFFSFEKIKLKPETHSNPSPSFISCVFLFYISLQSFLRVRFYLTSFSFFFHFILCVEQYNFIVLKQKCNFWVTKQMHGVITITQFYIQLVFCLCDFFYCASICFFNVAAVAPICWWFQFSSVQLLFSASALILITYSTCDTWSFGFTIFHYNAK